MKITEEEYAEVVRESQKFDFRIVVEVLKFAAGIALMTLILYGLRYGG